MVKNVFYGGVFLLFNGLIGPLRGPTKPWMINKTDPGAEPKTLYNNGVAGSYKKSGGGGGGGG
ncbi:hypothetical protein ACVGWD_05095, partial [Enterobacter asburiae]